MDLALQSLERRGSGIIYNMPRELVALSGCMREAWNALLNGKGYYDVFLGAGTGIKEFFYGLEQPRLNQPHHPLKFNGQADFYDILPELPQDFRVMQEWYPDVNATYHPNTDLRCFEFPERYIGNTRIISTHGIWDYPPPPSIANLLSQIVRIKPEFLSMRLCLMRDAWIRKFAEEQGLLALETKSYDRLVRRDVTPIGLPTLERDGIRQVQLPTNVKREHNLDEDYPASHFLPDKLTGFLMQEGYSFPLMDAYDTPMNTSLFLLFQKRPRYY